MHLTRGFNTAHVTLALLVFLSDLSTQPAHQRKCSEHFQYINQGLEILEAMEECSAAQKIGHSVREFVASLSGQNATLNEFQMDSSASLLPNPLFGNFNAFLPVGFENFE